MIWGNKMDKNNTDCSNKLEYIYKAMDDTSNTIRALDAKINYIFVETGIVFALLAVVFNEIFKFYKDNSSKPYISGAIFLLLIAYIVCILISIYNGYITLYPKNNPQDKVNNENINVKNLWYLLNDDKNDLLKMTLKDYNDKLKSMSEDDILTSVSFELMKLSYIRNIKLKTSNRCINYFYISVAIFCVVMIILFVHYFIVNI